VEPEGQLAEDTEGPEGAHHELGDVVAADGLHDLGPSPGHHSVRLDETHSEQQVAHGAIAGSQRAARVGRREPAQRPALHPGRIERKELPSRPDARRERAHRGPRLHGDREVVGVVLDDAIEPSEVEDQVQARRRVTELEGVAAAPGHDGQLRVPGEGEHAAHVLE